MNEQQCVTCDMRKDNSDFCVMWGCKCLGLDYSCPTCSVISDLEDMAAAYHIKFQITDHAVNMKAA